jgi:hypothetical protein
MLLSLLSAARDQGTRAAARSAQERLDRETGPCFPLAMSPPLQADSERVNHRWSIDWALLEQSVHNPSSVARGEREVVHSVVTALDGRGRGSVVISVRRRLQRRTAMFLCDVERGILDVVGEVEPESDRAGLLFDDLLDDRPGSCAADAHELALGLLAGSLMLGDGRAPRPVRDWLDGTLGPGFQPAAFSATLADSGAEPIPVGEMLERVRDLLDACPSWLDESPLAHELAKEIWLREGRVAADPQRDAGAYRFLFEHRLIHRLELYRRMLIWMGWVWRCSGQPELSRSAQALVCQLSDEQYAVPAHPFHVELTTRSIKAAQARLHSSRANRRPAERA